MSSFPARQVHLDFHTSEHIPGVGSRFSKKQFQEALQLGRVNWINVFAKGHHGWSFYPTKVGAVHPTLEIDLLGQQIEACHEIGVKVPIYYTVGWSVHDAETHPEWCVRERDGKIKSTNIDTEAKPEDRRPACSWHFMCPSGGYLELMLRQTEEICEKYLVDGLWYDITNGPICYCETCRAGMEEEGIDLDDLEGVVGYNTRKWSSFMEESKQLVLKQHAEATVYYNGTTVLYADGVTRAATWGPYKWNTQQELEDLPTTWGGYDKFPLRSKFFHKTRQPLIAMSGKFHTSWGEFGGFKHPDAIRYEAASMISFGAACNFGDQLHPLGEMDLGTYGNLGKAFAYVEKIEEYGVGGRPAANLGLWRTGEQADDEGVASMLLEIQRDFEVVDPEGDLAKYEAIVLTGAACLSEAEAKRVNAYVRDGGGLLVLGKSGLDRQEKEFLIDVGASYVGSPAFDEDFLVVDEALSEGLVASPFLNYEAGIRVKAEEGTEQLASIREPYFDRTYGKYCSHQNTPNQFQAAAHPGGLRKGKVVFLPHALGRIYHVHGARVHRQLFANALGMIYREPMVETMLPSAGRVNLLHQPEQRRYVAHLLYGPALQRGRCLVIEDLVPLFDVPVMVRLPEEVKGARLVPDGEEIACQRGGGTVKVVVPKVECHRAVVFDY
jgi:hypothetical protein